MPDIMTPEQAAEYLQLDVQTVRRHCRQDTIPAAKVGRGWRIRKIDLDDFLSQGGGRQRSGQVKLSV